MCYELQRVESSSRICVQVLTAVCNKNLGNTTHSDRDELMFDTSIETLFDVVFLKRLHPTAIVCVCLC